MPRKDIEFRTSDDVKLRGWLYLPKDITTPVPAVVMTHGFSAVKEMYLDKFAEVFVEAGLAVLVYDHRNFGASDGEPRQEIDPWGQIRDYRDAITYLTLRAEIDAHRIGIWGSSYSGGHVLVIGAIDNRVKCIVSQVPVISGLYNARHVIPKEVLTMARKKFNDDRMARFMGKLPAMIPVVSLPEKPYVPCALPTADSWEWFTETYKERAPNWKNEITLRSVEMLYEYDPGSYIPEINSTPLLMIVARDDKLAVAQITIDAFEEADEPKKLVKLDGGHFDVYDKTFSQSSSAARDWFVRYLLE